MFQQNLSMELEINGKDFSFLADFICEGVIIKDFVFAMDMSTIYSWIKAQASIFSLALETRLQNKTSTVPHRAYNTEPL